jgi:hypothetical protein
VNLRSATVAMGAVLISAGGWAASPANASTGWSVQPTPSPGHANYLTSVSCVSGGTCEAVGDYGPPNQETELPLAMGKTSGSRWAMQTAANPASGYQDGLDGVSCVSASFCAAAGWETTQQQPQDTFPMAETWNGTSWTLQPTPNPPGVDSSLSAVSCLSPTACMAVGSYGNSSEVDKAFTEFWNGKTWALVPFTDKFYDVFLTGVSCPSASFCLAVGQANRTDLSATWNGTAWTVSAMPNPGGGYTPLLNGLSCASATACTVVGSAFTAADAQKGLAQRWNGTKWSFQSVPKVQLNDVSCATASTCVAVGQAFADKADPVALGWSSATGWTSQATASPPKANHSELDGVSCQPSGPCTATGSYSLVTVSGTGGRPLAEQN